MRHPKLNIKGRSKIVLATWEKARDICAAITDNTRGVMGQLMSIDSDCKEKFILSRKIEAAEEELDDGEDETDDDLEEKNTMIWIGLRFNQTNSRFEWQNGAKFEHDMWVSSCSIYPTLHIFYSIIVIVLSKVTVFKAFVFRIWINP